MSAANKDLRILSKVELPKGEEGIWMMIQKLDREGSWTIADIACFVDMRQTVVGGYVARLEKAGFVRRLDDGKRKAGRVWQTLFQQTKPSLSAPRISKTGEMLPELKIETIWRTMRMLKRFTIPELAAYVGTPDAPANEPSVRAYVCELARVEILACEGGCEGGHGHNTYRLLRQLGPRAPKILTARIIFDPNSRSTVGTAEAHEAAR